MADEQAALRRVADLVAHRSPDPEVYHAVTREVGTLLGGISTLIRVDRSGTLHVVSRGGVVASEAADADVLLHERAVVAEIQRSSPPFRLRGTSRRSEPPPAHRAGDSEPAATMGVPVVVEEQLWGVLTASLGAADLFDPAGSCLPQFGELVTASVANTVTRNRLEELAAEQAALLRVAGLVAAAEAPQLVFDTVTAETSALLGGRPVTLVRYASDHEIVVVSAPSGPVPLGTVIEFEPGTQPDRVWRGGSIDRVDDFTDEPTVLLAARYGLVGTVSAPIAVGGRVWGTLTATSTVEPLPEVTEARLDKFAQLVSAMLTNAESQDRLRGLVEEQAGLRRVAELVAGGVALGEVFEAATTEASRMLGGNGAALMRYDEAGPVRVAFVVSGEPVPNGARVLVDPVDRSATRRPERPVRVDGAGRLLPDPADHQGSAGEVAIPVTVEGRLWGALTTITSSPPLPDESAARLTPFADLVAAAISNAENRAALSASRARVIATADETRRRLQRDVHDGAQQRLVHTIIVLKLALQAVRTGQPSGDLLEEALANAERANRELRDTVHGILPATLTRSGLRAALQEVVADVSIPVDLSVRVARLPGAVETTAYFVVAEAMTNVVKHSRATRASVDVHLEGQTLVLEVCDDGVGGADPRGGTGLTGLSDRVEAGAGTLTVISERQSGTTLRATIALAPPAPPDITLL